MMIGLSFKRDVCQQAPMKLLICFVNRSFQNLRHITATLHAILRSSPVLYCPPHRWWGNLNSLLTGMWLILKQTHGIVSKYSTFVSCLLFTATRHWLKDATVHGCKSYFEYTTFYTVCDYIMHVMLHKFQTHSKMCLLASLYLLVVHLFSWNNVAPAGDF